MDETIISENLVNVAYSLANHSVADVKRLSALLQPDEMAALKVYLSLEHKLLEVPSPDDAPPIENQWWW